MAISHVCMACGEDLAGIRPGPEPHYGLCVVACPECARPSVRGRDEVRDWWRAARMRVGAVLLLAAHAAVLGSLGMIASIGSLMVGTEAVRGRVPRPKDWVGIAMLLGIVPMVAGIWLGLTMPRRRVLMRTGVWVAASLTPLVVVVGFQGYQAIVHRWYDSEWIHPWPHEMGAIGIRPYLAWAGLVVVTAVPCALGALPGMFVRFIWTMSESALFRRRRRAARKQRSG